MKENEYKQQPALIKNEYKQPTFIKIGRVIKETQGMGGTSLDGGGTYTQAGGGNDLM